MNDFKEKLRNGRHVLGLSILYESPAIIESLNGQGWDWVWLDGQHALRQHTWLDHIRACEIIDVPSVLRVPSMESHFISYALDLGVWNVMVPMIESADQARDVVQAAHFPPLGSRSVAGTRPIALYGLDYMEMAAEQVLIIVQVETRAGMKNLEEIAKVEGVDALLIGTGDLCLSLGMPFSQKDSSREIEQAIRRVGREARNNGKYAGIICTPESIPARREQGYSFFSLSMSVDIISTPMGRIIDEARRLVE